MEHICKLETSVILRYSSRLRQRNETFAQWGHPKTTDDLTSIFIHHLQSNISTTPFSPGPLSPESLLILPSLLKLNQLGRWTVGSQPAVDGAASSDDVVGWGPRNGYVFQKAFVEFFCDFEDVQLFEKKMDEEGKGWVVWFAGNNEVRSPSISVYRCLTRQHNRVNSKVTFRKIVEMR
jgi:methylenetetrahydrofolate reductase (NADPH)